MKKVVPYKIIAKTTQRQGENNDKQASGNKIFGFQNPNVLTLARGSPP